jgi:hypothetical protein
MGLLTWKMDCDVCDSPFVTILLATINHKHWDCAVFQESASLHVEDSCNGHGSFNIWL